MRVTFLGTGTSHGIPVLGCSCPVCLSSDPGDKRYRSSIMVESGNGGRIVVDTGYEFRLQLLRENVADLDAVLYTHAHMDHVAGLDDLRVFSQKKSLSVYGNKNTLDTIRKVFGYAVHEPGEGFPGVPHLTPVELEPLKPVEIAGMEVVPIPVEHGRVTHMPIYGWRFGRFAYITDCTFIPDGSFEALRGVEVLAIGALRETPHGAHFSFSEAMEASRRIGAKRTYFTHINHSTSRARIDSLFPDAESAYDGLRLEIPEN